MGSSERWTKVDYFCTTLEISIIFSIPPKKRYFLSIYRKPTVLERITSIILLEG